VDTSEDQRVPPLAADREPWLGSSFELVESKLHPPSARPGIVPRTALVEQLLAQATPFVGVVAPAGYGKTTLLAQWAERKGDRVAWVSVDRPDNDPVVLLSHVAVALDRVEPIDPHVFQALASQGATTLATVVPRLASAVAAMTEPVAVVLDHLELLDSPECLDAVAELAVRLPEGSQLLLASRRPPPLPVALLRAQGQMLELGVDELAMDQQEARALLEGAGVGLTDTEVAELTSRTEGWPVGLYLAALATKAGGRHQVGMGFTGDDRFMADYLRSELLARLSPELVTFLTRTAVLDRMSGPLCDAVLATSGSDRVLSSLEDSNLLVVPLDRHRHWYRYHHLFRELLGAELERREPELFQTLHARAAAWCEANGLAELAIDHAQTAGDADRVARLVAGLIQPTYAAGRVDTASRWLAWFEDQKLVDQYPPVAVFGAWVQALVGEPAGAERWADAAERPAPAASAALAARTPPDGSTMESYLAMLRGLLCRNGVGRMRADAQVALAGLSPASQWRTTALLLEGVAALLDGHPDQADPILAHAVELGTRTGILAGTATALAERAIVAMGRQQWHEATTLTNQALGLLETGRLNDYFISPLVHTVVARTALHRGDVPQAKAHLVQAAGRRPLLTYAVPSVAVQTLVELGRAYLMLEDAAGARTVLRQARGILQLRPDLGVLPDQAEELHAKLDSIRGGVPGVSTLTTAELRLLPLLATHLNFAEIGQRLYLSKHTAKSHAASIYRKLSASSRSQAVQRLQEIGLLEE
jgi:LuxR family transcriptional regulator, maltose regulon positive regulatory protein